MTGLAPGSCRRSSVTAGGDLDLLALRVVGAQRHVEAEMDARVRDVAVLKVARVGRVAETGDPLRPFVLLDENGAEVTAVSEFLHHMLADDARRPGSGSRRCWS